VKRKDYFRLPSQAVRGSVDLARDDPAIAGEARGKPPPQWIAQSGHGGSWTATGRYQGDFNGVIGPTTPAKCPGMTQQQSHRVVAA